MDIVGTRIFFHTFFRQKVKCRIRQDTIHCLILKYPCIIGSQSSGWNLYGSGPRLNFVMDPNPGFGAKSD